MDLTHVAFQGKATIRRHVERHDRPARAPQDLAAPRRDGSPAAPDTPLAAFVLGQAGLPASAYRGGPLLRRTAACLRALRADSEEAAIAKLRARPELLGTALSTVLIGVSSFFRDAFAFQTILAAVLPALGATRRPLRIMSVACANGEELYSIAMMLAEAGLLERAHLLGTDCRGDAIAAARAGWYGDEALADIDPRWRGRYFERGRRGGSRIAAGLRAAVQWQQADATRGIAAGPWDLVLCRNLFIYLHPQTNKAMFERLAAAIAPGGFLVLGKAERPPPGLRLATIGRCVFRKHGV